MVGEGEKKVFSSLLPECQGMPGDLVILWVNGQVCTLELTYSTTRKH